MNDSVKEDTESKKEAQLLTREDSEKELEGISAILEGVVTPFAQAQETSEKEATKRASIVATVANRAILALFGIAFMILVLAVNKQLTRRSSSRPMAAGRLSAAAVLQR